MIILGALLALCVVVAALVYGPLLAQGVPIGFIRVDTVDSVTYTPPHGPRSSILLDSRPEVIVRQYVTDYLRLAGTYPCAQDPAHYMESTDIYAGHFLGDGHCTVTRPVASFTIPAVTIRAGGLANPSRALVSVRVVYRDGSQWQGQIELVADQSQGPWPLATHLTCWASIGTMALFGQLTPDIPSGARYVAGPQSSPVFRCKS